VKLIKTPTNPIRIPDLVIGRYAQVLDRKPLILNDAINLLQARRLVNQHQSHTFTQALSCAWNTASIINGKDLNKPINERDSSKSLTTIIKKEDWDKVASRQAGLITFANFLYILLGHGIKNVEVADAGNRGDKAYQMTFMQGGEVFTGKVEARRLKKETPIVRFKVYSVTNKSNSIEISIGYDENQKLRYPHMDIRPVSSKDMNICSANPEDEDKKRVKWVHQHPLKSTWEDSFALRGFINGLLNQFDSQLSTNEEPFLQSRRDLGFSSAPKEDSQQNFMLSGFRNFRQLQLACLN
jgi:hypothetical protein